MMMVMINDDGDDRGDEVSPVAECDRKSSCVLFHCTGKYHEPSSKPDQLKGHGLLSPQCVLVVASTASFPEALTVSLFISSRK